MGLWGNSRSYDQNTGPCELCSLLFHDASLHIENIYSALWVKGFVSFTSQSWSCTFEFSLFGHLKRHLSGSSLEADNDVNLQGACAFALFHLWENALMLMAIFEALSVLVNDRETKVTWNLPLSFQVSVIKRFENRFYFTFWTTLVLWRATKDGSLIFNDISFPKRLKMRDENSVGHDWLIFLLYSLLKLNWNSRFNLLPLIKCQKIYILKNDTTLSLI